MRMAPTPLPVPARTRRPRPWRSPTPRGTIESRARARPNGSPNRIARRCKRQVWVEPQFAEAKDWRGLRRFRLRRLWRVNSEALLIAARQNLTRLLRERGWAPRPLPPPAAQRRRPGGWTIWRWLLPLGIAGRGTQRRTASRIGTIWESPRAQLTSMRRRSPRTTRSSPVMRNMCTPGMAKAMRSLG
jgi:hypothetical protein